MFGIIEDALNATNKRKLFHYVNYAERCGVIQLAVTWTWMRSYTDVNVLFLIVIFVVVYIRTNVLFSVAIREKSYETRFFFGSRSLCYSFFDLVLAASVKTTTTTVIYIPCTFRSAGFCTLYATPYQISWCWLIRPADTLNDSIYVAHR